MYTKVCFNINQHYRLHQLIALGNAFSPIQFPTALPLSRTQKHTSTHVNTTVFTLHMTVCHYIIRHNLTMSLQCPVEDFRTEAFSNSAFSQKRNVDMLVSMCMLLHCFIQGLCKFVHFPVSHIRTLYNAHSCIFFFFFYMYIQRQLKSV